ncbi:FecR family protein [Puteibacter caeruleilacunae]|nr:FecR family protein [Puteibacter caeruleilacunae]
MKMNTEILTDYLNGKCDIETKKSIQRWIKEDSKHESYFNELTLYWNAKNERKNAIHVDADKAYRKIRQDKRVKRTIRLQQLIKHAAVIAIIMATTIIGYYSTKLINNQTLITNWEEVDQEIILPDDSKVLLAGGSSIEFHNNFSKKVRAVRLAGEAFFDIERNPEKPFIISTNFTQTRVLGTSFWLSEIEDRTIIKVKSGVVEFKGFNSNANIIQLHKGDIAKFNHTQKVLLIHNEIDPTNKFKVRHLSFEKKPLKQICSDLSKLFEQPVLLEDPTLGKRLLTATFENEGLESILHSMCFSLDLDFDITEKQILLKARN